jgi:hypothetical protein
MLVDTLWAVLRLSNSVPTYFFSDSVDKLNTILGYLVAMGGGEGSKDLGSISLFKIYLIYYHPDILKILSYLYGNVWII